MITKANLLAYRSQLLDQLALVNGMLENFNKLAGLTPTSDEPAALSSALLSAVPSIGRQRRVRGVLAAVRDIVEELPDAFDKNDILAKLRERDSKLAANVSPANLRNTLRLLTRRGDIEVHTDATSKSCAKYVRKHAAA